MFQYQTGTTEVVESDVTGDCVARYIAGTYVMLISKSLFIGELTFMKSVIIRPPSFCKMGTLPTFCLEF